MLRLSDVGAHAHGPVFAGEELIDEEVEVGPVMVNVDVEVLELVDVVVAVELDEVLVPVVDAIVIIEVELLEVEDELGRSPTL